MVMVMMMKKKTTVFYQTEHTIRLRCRKRLQVLQNHGFTREIVTNHVFAVAMIQITVATQIPPMILLAPATSLHLQKSHAKVMTTVTVARVTVF